MHELSIASYLIETVKKTAQEYKMNKIYNIYLSIGNPPSVVPEAIDFCFSSVAKNTIADGAKLHMEKKGEGLFIQKIDCDIDE